MYVDIQLFINVERTKNELGVDIFKLKPNSEKLVYKICEICKKEELKKFRYISVFGQTKCIRCSNILNGRNNRDKISATNTEYFKTHRHPRLGVKHTEETKAKILRNRKPTVYTPELRAKMSLLMRGRNLGKRHSPETIKKLQESAKKNVRRGKDSNFYGKSYCSKKTPYARIDGRIVNMRSRWEAKFAEYLDKNNIPWEYEKTFFPVTYEYEGETKHGTYIPDFFLSNEIIEIKGYWRKDALVKFQAFKEQYPDLKISVLQKKELRDLGIKL